MHKTTGALLLVAALLAGCGGGGGSTSTVPTVTSSATPTATATPVVTGSARKYSGTASVGDFLTISIDSTAKTLTYKNTTNGDTGTLSYTVNADGSYAISDPSGNFTTAYEVPNYAVIIAANKVGPNHNTAALITAVTTGPISVASFGNHSYNYLNFRTTAGGMEAGNVNVDAAGNLSINAYWPLGAYFNNTTPFLNGALTPKTITADPSGTFLTMTEASGTSDYVFGTANGLFAVDTNSGTIFGMPKAATKAFDPTVAGTYNAIVYSKNAAIAAGGEQGTGTLANVSITIDAAANVTVKDSQNNTVASGALMPMADAAYLVGANEVGDPCFGLFTYRVTTATTTQDVFVAFQSHAVFFSTFTSTNGHTSTSPYNYSYGVGLK